MTCKWRAVFALYVGLYLSIDSTLDSSFFTWALDANQTIDDAFAGDDTTSITYLPAVGGWNIGQDCGGCHVQPDRTIAHSGTWHDSTADTQLSTAQHSLVFNFVGTALYVYCIMANTIPNTGTNSKFSFLMDGSPSGPDFNHAPSTTGPTYEYNVLVYSTQGLSNTSHTFTLNLNGGPGIDGSSLILFDYLVYTRALPDPPPPPPPPPPSSSSSSPTTHPTSSSNPPSSTVNVSTTAQPTPIGNTQSILGSSSSPPSDTSSQNGTDPTAVPGTGGQTIPKHSNLTAPIVGGSVGGVVVLLLLAALAYFGIRRKRGPLPPPPEPFAQITPHQAMHPSMPPPSEAPSFGNGIFGSNSNLITAPYPASSIPSSAESSSFYSGSRPTVTGLTSSSGSGQGGSLTRRVADLERMVDSITPLGVAGEAGGTLAMGGAGAFAAPNSNQLRSESSLSTSTGRVGAISPTLEVASSRIGGSTHSNSKILQDNVALQAQVYTLQEEMDNLRARYERRRLISIGPSEFGTEEPLPQYESL